MDFKIGDRVQLVKADCDHINKIGTVTGVSVFIEIQLDVPSIEYNEWLATPDEIVREGHYYGF